MQRRLSLSERAQSVLQEAVARALEAQSAAYDALARGGASIIEVEAAAIAEAYDTEVARKKAAKARERAALAWVYAAKARERAAKAW